jgi:hypothetical protein
LLLMFKLMGYTNLPTSGTILPDALSQLSENQELCTKARALKEIPFWAHKSGAECPHDLHGYASGRHGRAER